MDGVLTSAAESVVALGFQGVVMVALCLVIHAQYRDGKAKDAVILDLQNKRLEEARETITVLSQNTTALNSLSDVVKARRDG